MKEQPKILLVEDDNTLGILLEEFLSSEGFDVCLARDGESGFQSFLSHTFDICLLDVMLPKQDGFSLGKKIKAEKPKIPILFLTAKALKDDVIEGLKLGADDYITKPFDEEELLLRIQAVLRRSNSNNEDHSQEEKELYEFGTCLFSYKDHTLTVNGQLKKLTPKESVILRLLCRHTNEVVKRETALIAVYGENDYFVGRSFDVFITKLRKHLKEVPSVSIENVHGVGFKLQVENH